MNVYIFTDMEGISGISSSQFVSDSGTRFAEGRRYYTDDMNVCARACFEAGAENVLVRDGHGGGIHALWDKLDERVELIQGPSGPVRMPGLDECHGLILLGYHAMAGTPGALLEHTYSSREIQNLWLNGRKAGEIGIDATIAAEHGVPVILVTGDRAACREAKDWTPAAFTCSVKEALGCQGARLASRAEAHRRLAAATSEAVAAIGTIRPIQTPQPACLRREVVERGSVKKRSANDIIIDARTIETTADTLEEALLGPRE